MKQPLSKHNCIKDMHHVIANQWAKELDTTAKAQGKTKAGLIKENRQKAFQENLDTLDLTVLDVLYDAYNHDYQMFDYQHPRTLVT